MTKGTPQTSVQVFKQAQCFTFQELIVGRGWGPHLISKVLGEPDGVVHEFDNPSGLKKRAYLKSRVIHAESEDTFRSHQKKQAQRKVLSCEDVFRRTQLISERGWNKVEISRFLLEHDGHAHPGDDISLPKEEAYLKSRVTSIESSDAFQEFRGRKQLGKQRDAHAVWRAKTRCGLELSIEDLREICKSIQEGRSERIFEGKGTGPWHQVMVKGNPLLVIYDPFLKKVKTAFPEEYRKSLVAVPPESRRKWLMENEGKMKQYFFKGIAKP